MWSAAAGELLAGEKQLNAVEIEEAISALAEQPFDAAAFPFAFLEAFGNKETTIKKLRSGASNKSDLSGPWGGVLQANNIHIATCAKGEVSKSRRHHCMASGDEVRNLLTSWAGCSTNVLTVPTRVSGSGCALELVDIPDDGSLRPKAR